MFAILPEGPQDGPAIEHLLDLSFGPNRRRKISYRYRSGVAPIAELCLVARGADGLVGSIRYWPVRLGDRPVLLLGPLAIDPERRGQGIGRALIRASLARAEAMGWRLVFLVGDPAYYAQHGFRPVPAGVIMPGEDPARLQYVTLGGAELPAAGGLLLRADGHAIAGDPVEIGEERAAHPGEALVGGHAVLDLAEAGGHGGGDAGAAHAPRERLEQRADAERHRPGLGQAAQGLPLDAKPEPLARILGRQVQDRLAAVRVK